MLSYLELGLLGFALHAGVAVVDALQASAPQVYPNMPTGDYGTDWQSCKPCI